MFAIDGQSSAGHLKKQMKTFALINHELSAVPHSIEKLTLLNFVNFSTIFCPRLSEETNISNLAQIP